MVRALAVTSTTPWREGTAPCSAAVASSGRLEVTNVGSLSPWHWAIIAILVIVLFGAKKLPDAARSLGKSMRIFRSEMREMQTEDKAEASALETNTATNTANPTPVQSQRVDPPAATEQGHTEARPA
jgi:sec-independent protein translocase protein TatA